MQRLAQNQLVPKERLTDLGVGNVAPSSTGPLTVADVEACQANWANAIQTISKTYLEKGDYIQAAADAAGELYGYGHSKVLFKPTKAAEEPFRPTGEMAMSYFVGSKAVENGIPEDGGFAINGGEGWSKVVFKNHDIELQGDTAIGWAPTGSRARPPATRSRSSTPSATSATRTASRASSSTTRR